MVQINYLLTSGVYHLKIAFISEISVEMFVNLQQDTIATSIVVAVLFGVIFYWVFLKFKKLPPGPWGLPLFGYLPFLGSFPPLQFGKMVSKYGGIISMRFGSTLVLTLNDFEAIRDTLMKESENYSGRMTVPSFTRMLKRKHTGLLIGDGPELKDNRRHFLSTFRDLGMGKNSMEMKILDEICEFKEKLLETKSIPTDFSFLLAQSVSNVISLLCFGHRYTYDDPININLIEALKTTFQYSGNTSIDIWLPWLTTLPVIRRFFIYSRIHEYNYYIVQFVQREIEEHRRVHVDGDNSDYVHAYFNEMEHGNNPAFNSGYLMDNSAQLFKAGTDTTSTTLQWSLLYMLMYPEVQLKVQKEIDEAYGDQCPSFSNKLRTPYTEAVIMEVLRLATTVPLSVFRTNFHETTVHGYNIPKRTATLTNLWYVHHNAEYFPDPEAFKPERFIGEDGKFRNIEQFIPFGAGKRSCVGEALARMELYLYFTCLLQSFTFHKEEGAILTTEPNYGITTTPNPFRVSAIPRNL